MSDETLDDQELVERLVEMANEIDIADTDDLRQVIENADVVFGVWQDVLSKNGVGIRTIKGEGKLGVIIHTGMAQNLGLTAVRCTCAEQAEAMRQVYGDKANLT